MRKEPNKDTMPPNSRQIQNRIHERLAACSPKSQVPYNLALNIFCDLCLEYDSLQDFQSLCVFIPTLCLQTPASLYMRGNKASLHLQQTTLDGEKNITFPESVCWSEATIIRHANVSAAPLFSLTPEPHLLGVLCLHKKLTALEKDFYTRYAQRIARILDIKQTASVQSQRLSFVNDIMRDIGHNVIVPNLHFKLLFLQMEQQIEALKSEVEHLDPGPGQKIPTLVDGLQTKLGTISRRFQQSSLFLESLLRRSHFEKGKYDLVQQTWKFKSQIFGPQWERFRPLLRSQGIDVRLAPGVRRGEDICLEVDLGLISQVFANLLSNAVKYTKAMPLPNGGQQKLLLYGWETLPYAFGPDTSGIKLFISSTGPEIPAPDATRLFDPDFRASSSKTTEGSGHGLHFVRQIVSLHKGSVGYTYAAPMNVFYIILPFPRGKQTLITH